MKSLILTMIGLAVAFSLRAQPGPDPNPSAPPGEPARGLPRPLENRDQLPPGLDRGEQTPEGAAIRTNLPPTSNIRTNEAGNTNQAGAATNSPAGGTNEAVSPTPQNFAESDRALLVKLRQSALAEIRAIGINQPVDFTVQHGVVTILGSLPADQRQRVVNILHRVPGVVQVH
jgi:hypothetical protein